MFSIFFLAVNLQSYVFEVRVNGYLRNYSWVQCHLP